MKVFAQAFEEVPEETIEALRATGANRIQMFFGAVLPSSFTALIARRRSGLKSTSQRRRFWNGRGEASDIPLWQR
ncbi:MAG: hypothetical protein ACLUOI_39050 [Eisenbergiella sp.]